MENTSFAKMGVRSKLNSLNIDDDPSLTETLDSSSGVRFGNGIFASNN